MSFFSFKKKSNTEQPALDAEVAAQEAFEIAVKKSIDSLVPEAGKFKIERSESERYYYKSNQEKKIESHYPCGNRRALLCSGTVCACIQCGSRNEKLCRLLRIGSVTFMYSPAADGDNYRRGKIVFYIRFRLF